MTRWTSTTEQLPDDGSYVLVDKKAWPHPRVLEFRLFPHANRFLDRVLGRWWSAEDAYWQPLPKRTPALTREKERA